MERKSFITNIDKVLHEQVEMLALNNNLTVNEMIEIIIKYGVDNSKAVCRIIKSGQMTAAYRAAHPVTRTIDAKPAADAKPDDKTARSATADKTTADASADKTPIGRGKTVASTKTITTPKTEAKTVTIPKADSKTTVAAKPDTKTTAAAKADTKTTVAPKTEAKTTARTIDNTAKTVSASKLHAGVATFKIPPMPKTTTAPTAPKSPTRK